MSCSFGSSFHITLPGKGEERVSSVPEVGAQKLPIWRLEHFQVVLKCSIHLMGIFIVHRRKTYPPPHSKASNPSK